MKTLEELEKEKSELKNRINEINMDIQDHYSADSFLELSVAGLKKKLEGVPDDAPVLLERIPDIYFDENGWKGRELYNCAAGKSEFIPVFAVNYLEGDSVVAINALW